MIDRVMRTFDQVRDPATFVLGIDEELAALEQQMPQLAMQQLQQLIGAGGQAGPAGPPVPPPLGPEAGGVG